MKTKKTNLKKTMSAVLAFILIGFILVTVNQFVGNPVSKMLVNRAAQKYVDEKYSDLDLEIDKAVYDFKNGMYIVEAKADKSIDTHFDMNFTWTGKLDYDSYESNVLDRWNTWTRINQEYRDLTDTVFEDNFPYKTDIYYGEFIDKSDEYSHLELDKRYDIKELGKTEGKLTLYVESKTQNKEMMAEVLLSVKEGFDKKDIPFYSIDLTLENPREEDGDYEQGLMIMDFLYEDIYLEDLEERVEKNIEDTKKFSEEQADEKQEEIDQFEKDIKEGDKD